jgi:hypothetical protein
LFRGDFSSFITRPVTHNSSRKAFLARLLGVTALLGSFPKLFAKAATTSVITPDSNARPFELRPDARAVARRADSV